MNSFTITIQRKAGEQWPVVLEEQTAESALAIRREGLLSLDLAALATQVTPHDYGRMLGQALFQGEVRDAFLHARAQSADRLSVQLFLEAPDLRMLRWERLCAPLDDQWRFLLLDQRAPLSLALPSQADRRFPPIRREDLHALVVVASPEGLERYRLSPFDVEATVSSVRSALGTCPCDVLANAPGAVGPPTLDALCERLTSTSYTLLHVVCHGRHLPELGDTVLYLATAEQQVDPVVGSRLLDRLSQVRGERGLPHFAFLATCESASPQAEGDLGGLAQRLVRELGLPAVLAMTDTVSISTAQVLTSQFYQRLVAHGHLDVALAEACAGLAAQPDSTVAALYSRLGTRPLFEQAVVSPTATTQHPLSLTETQRQRNRSRMLDRVQSIWVKGVLEPSVQGAAQIALELENKPSAVVTPLWQEVREFDTTGPLSSAESSIEQVYDHANGEVLILGEPGAGKTTLLLELTRDLLERARQEETHPIPVVFSLSSWATKRQPLAEWLASELHSRYQVPLPLATSWIETDQVLPLLDGLDEVAAPHRAACVEAINTYRQAHGLLPTVVCSRQTDYLVLSTRLLLRTAVVVQPLTPEQIETYLESVGKQAETLRTALRQDGDLRELATTPLMLTILLFAYKGTSADKISELTSLGAKREQLFASYVQHMLKRRGASKRYQPEQITHWLTCLARQMKRQNQTLFYLERIQPDWLPAGWSRWLYLSMLAVLVFGVPNGLLVGLYNGLFATPILGLFSGLLAVPILGMLNGLLGELGRDINLIGVGIWSWAGMRRNLVRFLLNGLLGLVFIDFSSSGGRWIGWLVVGMFSGLILGQIGRLDAEIQPTEVLAWSWAGMRRNLVRFLLNGLLVSLGGSLFFWLLNVLAIFLPHWGRDWLQPSDGLMILIQQLRNLLPALLAGLFFISIFGLIFGLNSGLSSKMLDERSIVKPNQGIWHSARNSMLSGLIIGLINLFVFGLLYGPHGLLIGGLFVGVLVGLFGGLASGLLNGGVACIQHGVLRWLLWRNEFIPWSYVRFLDYAAERILLRKVGGGYIFLHRLLLDYFAAQESAPVLDEPTERRQSSTPAPVSPSNVPSEPTVPTVLPNSPAPTISLAPAAAPSESPRLLPCGHEPRADQARFCRVCGASVAP